MNPYYDSSKDYVNRWIISYADLVTLLLALFLVLFAVNNAQNRDVKNIPGEYSVKQEQNTNMPILQKELLRDFKNKEGVEVLKDNRGLILRLNDTLLFENGNAKINNTCKPIFEKLIDILSKTNNFVIIEGHTDALPIKSERYSSNWELSTARATSVICYLIKSKRINPKRLSAVGYGDNIPIAENTTNSGRIKNRRVDIIILNK